MSYSKKKLKIGDYNLEVKSLNKITLQGNLFNFEEDHPRLEEDLKFDTIPETNIEYNDLVFTLKNHQGSYLRPVVKRKEGNLKVVGNRLFFSAIKGAGYDVFHFDLLKEDSMPLEMLMEEFGLSFPSDPKRIDYLSRFVFLEGNPNILPIPDESVISLNNSTYTPEFHKRNCISYNLHLNGDPKFVESKEHEFLGNLYRDNGRLRSINGLIKNFGKLKQFFI